jgi:hypothetical protein
MLYQPRSQGLNVALERESIVFEKEKKVRVSPTQIYDVTPNDGFIGIKSFQKYLCAWCFPQNKSYKKLQKYIVQIVHA